MIHTAMFWLTIKLFLLFSKNKNKTCLVVFLESNCTGLFNNFD